MHYRDQGYANYAAGCYRRLLVCRSDRAERATWRLWNILSLYIQEDVIRIRDTGIRIREHVNSVQDLKF